jgi:hypothetical protein
MINNELDRHRQVLRGKIRELVKIPVAPRVEG